MKYLKRIEKITIYLGYFFALLLFSFLFSFFINFFNKGIEISYTVVSFSVLAVNIIGFLIKRYL